MVRKINHITKGEMKMNTDIKKLLTKEEIEIIRYIKKNVRYLKEFHNVYYNGYKGYLGGYGSYNSDYVITLKVSANKIVGYSSYDEFIDRYLLQLHDDRIEAEDVYIAYYEAFKENMEQQLQQIQGKYDKGEEDLYKAYEIKTIWQFYIGFLMEKLITMYVDAYSGYRTVRHTEEYKWCLDNKYAVDIEMGLYGLVGVQSKSITYLNLSDSKKDIHLQKHKAYREKYNAETFYILSNDFEPCYYIDQNGDKVYLIASEDIKKFKVDQMHTGTYEELIQTLRRVKDGN